MPNRRSPRQNLKSKILMMQRLPPTTDFSGHQTAVAVAILYQGDRLLMQLRDNIPTIIYPGYWALFGGHVEPGEHPDQAVAREILEEINYTLPQIQLFGIYADEKIVRYVYQAPLLVDLKDLTLNEGWDMGLLTAADIRRGHQFSAQAGETRPIGIPPQTILLDFLQDRATLPSA
jgi:8-oxo-dGTP diphosphatase